MAEPRDRVQQARAATARLRKAGIPESADAYEKQAAEARKRQAGN